MGEPSEPVRILGVLAGSDMPQHQLQRWVESAELVVAADGGANLLHAIGFVPQATLGDLDSISEASSKIQAILMLNEDQDSTDCDKLLAHALRAGYRTITLAGVEGDLLDHVLGTIQSAARSPLQVRLALRRGIAWVVHGPMARGFSTLPNGRISVIPLERCEGVSMRGARWPLENSVLEPFGLTSLSNVAEGSEVELEIGSGTAFVFVETDGSPAWNRP